MELDWGAEIRTANLRGLGQSGMSSKGPDLGPSVGPVSTCSSLLPHISLGSKKGEERENTTSDGYLRHVILLTESLQQVFQEHLLCTGPISELQDSRINIRTSDFKRLTIE